MFGMVALLIGGPGILLADSILLGPNDFHPLSEDTVYEKSDMHIYLMPASSEYSFSAPVHLPQDARITSIVVFYYDDSGPENLIIALRKINVYTKTETFLATWASTGQTPSNQVYKITPITGGNRVDNGGYIYNVAADFSGSSAQTLLKLYAVKIIFTTT